MSYCALLGENATSGSREAASPHPRSPISNYRNQIDQLARHMSMILLATRDAMRNERSALTLGILTETTARWARPLVARVSAVEHRAAPSGAVPQDTVGALFDRDIEQVFRA